jgi:hypothetical protein
MDGQSEPPSDDSNCAGEKCYRIKVTVEEMLDSKGRRIVRRFPKRKGGE